jgi:hypothetical protein
MPFIPINYQFILHSYYFIDEQSNHLNINNKPSNDYDPNVS